MIDDDWDIDTILGRARQEPQPPQPPQEPQTAQADIDTTRTVMTAQSFFKDMQQLLNNARFDKRLTPATLLVYRTLCDLANRHYWLYPFVASEAELKEFTHINSNDTITRAKQRLKSLGYIDFEGKPTKYTIYSPVDQRPVQEPVNE